MSGRLKRRKRAVRVTLIVVAVATVGVAVTAATGLGLTNNDPETSEHSSLPPATAKVTKQTLVDTQNESGEVGHGNTVTVKSRLTGTLTSVPAVGTTITRGKALYKVDNKPVVLLYGSLPAYRALATGDSGKDVNQLEKNLKELGYSGFTVDNDYTWTTAEAVEDWQDDLGLTESGSVDLGQVVYASGPVRVDTHDAALGDPIANGGEVLDYSGTTKMITVDLDVEDQRLAKKGAAVTVNLPNSKSVNGKITSTATVIVTTSSSSSNASNSSGTETKARVTIAISDQKALDQFDSATVDVAFTASKVENVLTVPVAALLALAEGGYGVQIVEGGTTKIVGVKTGLFAGGQVEVSGDGLAEGQVVGMPA